MYSIDFAAVAPVVAMYGGIACKLCYNGDDMQAK